MLRRPLIIAVVGGTGSGKTTVARAIHDALGVDAVLLDQDAYYRDLAALTLEERRRVNFDHPDSIDTDLLVEQLEALAAGRPIEKPTYDFAAHTRADARIRIEPREVVIVEGILLLSDARLRALFDIKIFVDVGDDVRFIRRLLRDTSERGRTIENVIDQYLSTVRPMHLEFVEPSKRYADVILPEGGFNRIGIEMIQARVERELDRRRSESSAT
ncbi:MAG: uridine kinase [Gemmatimonadales bacterium]|nr:uridine kinase [Gemmatimonadales bacterium]